MSLSIAACKEGFSEILNFHVVNNYTGAAESTERLCHLKVANSSVNGVSADDARRHRIEMGSGNMVHVRFCQGFFYVSLYDIGKDS